MPEFPAMRLSPSLKNTLVLVALEITREEIVTSVINKRMFGDQPTGGGNLIVFNYPAPLI